MWYNETLCVKLGWNNKIKLIWISAQGEHVNTWVFQHKKKVNWVVPKPCVMLSLERPVRQGIPSLQWQNCPHLRDWHLWSQCIQMLSTNSGQVIWRGCWLPVKWLEGLWGLHKGWPLQQPFLKLLGKIVRWGNLFLLLFEMQKHSSEKIGWPDATSNNLVGRKGVLVTAASWCYRMMQSANCDVPVMSAAYGSGNHCVCLFEVLIWKKLARNLAWVRGEVKW